MENETGMLHREVRDRREEGITSHVLHACHATHRSREMGRVKMQAEKVEEGRGGRGGAYARIGDGELPERVRYASV